MEIVRGREIKNHVEIEKGTIKRLIQTKIARAKKQKIKRKNKIL